jgi:hypothetical protein
VVPLLANLLLIALPTAMGASLTMGAFRRGVPGEVVLVRRLEAGNPPAGNCCMATQPKDRRFDYFLCHLKLRVQANTQAAA